MTNYEKLKNKLLDNKLIAISVIVIGAIIALLPLVDLFSDEKENDASFDVEIEGNNNTVIKDNIEVIETQINETTNIQTMNVNVINESVEIESSSSNDYELEDGFEYEIDEFDNILMSKYNNMRFGFTVNIPQHWDNKYPPQNGDGVASVNSKRSGVEIRAFGSHSLSSLDLSLEEYAEWIIEVSESIIELKSNVESSVQAKIYFKNRSESYTELFGRRLEFIVNNDGVRTVVLRFMYEYDGILYEIVCYSPEKDYKEFENMFYYVGKNIGIINGIDK